MKLSAAGLFLLSVTITAAGCKTNTPIAADGALAWVEIHDKQPLEIARTVSETFQAAGFQPVPLPSNNELRLKFDKPASTGTSVLYGDWSFKPIWHRARVELKRADSDSFVVTCNAYRVSDRGDPHFEEEKKLSGLNRGPYQDLLVTVQRKLNPESKTK